MRHIDLWNSLLRVCVFPTQKLKLYFRNNELSMPDKLANLLEAAAITMGATLALEYQKQ